MPTETVRISAEPTPEATTRPTAARETATLPEHDPVGVPAPAIGTLVADVTEPTVEPTPEARSRCEPWPIEPTSATTGPTEPTAAPPAPEPTVAATSDAAVSKEDRTRPWRACR